MFTTTCSACGTVARFEDSEVPPSGILIPCEHCGSELTVIPPGMGLTHEATAEPSFEDLVDLPAPKTRVPREELPDLPVPVGPRSRRDLPDLLAPVGPRPTKGGVSDLLAPVSGQRGSRASDLLTPVAPRPPGQPPPIPGNRITNDLLAPVGPFPTKNLPEYPAPVGENSSFDELPDLLEPVGPESRYNAPDLLEPVGPEPVRNRPDLLEPVGPYPTKNTPDFPVPVGPYPTKNIDVPAPKGFFDEAPPPTPAAPHGAEGNAFDNDNDDLEMVPANDFNPVLDDNLRDHSRAGPIPSGFTMDDLDLGGQTPPPVMHGDEVPGGYGEPDLPEEQQQHDDGLVSFASPGAARPSGVSRTQGIELAETPKKKQGTLAGDLPASDRPTPSVRKKKRGVPKGLVIAILVAAALAGAAYYVYTSVELNLLGIMTVPAQDRQAQCVRGFAETRKLLGTSDVGHWGRAAEAAGRVVKLKCEEANDARALSVQAYSARAIEEGRDLKADKDNADKLLAEIGGGHGREFDKATALRSILDPGKASEAAAKLATTLTSDPKDGDAALFAGWAALEAKSYDRALSGFNTALKVTPDREPALVGKGRAQVGLRDNDNAKKTFGEVFAKYPNKKDYGAWLGLTELEKPPHTKEREDALAVLCESAPERETANPRDRARAFTLYADEAMAAGHWGQAFERYRQALTLNGQNVDALVGGALAAIEQRTHDAGNASVVDARKALDTALTIEAKNVPAMVGLVRINLMEGRADEARRVIGNALAVTDKNAGVYYWNGKALEDPAINDSAGAEASYKKAIELAPDDYTAYVALSQLYLGRARIADKLGKKADAKAATDQAVDVLAPIAKAAKNDKAYAVILGSAYAGARDLLHAEQWFRVAIQLDPGFVDAHVNLATTLEAENKLPDATAEWLKAYELATRREDIALGLARVQEKARKFDEADKIYKGLLSTDGGNIPSLRAMSAAGLYAARRNKIDDARKLGDQVAALDPQNAAGLYLKGRGLLADKKHADALRFFQDAIAIDPQAQYFETVGELQFEKKQFIEAKAAWESALKIDPNYAPAVFRLADLYVSSRTWAQAIPLLQQAAQLDPTVAKAFIDLGDAYRDLPNRGPDAKEAYEKALALDPKNREVMYKLGITYYDLLQQAGPGESYLRQAAGDPVIDTPWYPAAIEKLAYLYRSQRNRRVEMCAAFNRLNGVSKDKARLKDVKKDFGACL